ncbi:hypothetical protein T492DRAFT_834400 [Pavlovales sp. CCMP2436]|nr:hypothetical protein T492DRAFT_834400 [Pavlovales sp. CCMP2436]
MASKRFVGVVPNGAVAEDGSAPSVPPPGAGIAAIRCGCPAEAIAERRGWSTGSAGMEAEPPRELAAPPTTPPGRTLASARLSEGSQWPPWPGRSCAEEMSLVILPPFCTYETCGRLDGLRVGAARWAVRDTLTQPPLAFPAFNSRVGSGLRVERGNLRSRVLGRGEEALELIAQRTEAHPPSESGVACGGGGARRRVEGQEVTMVSTLH